MVIYGLFTFAACCAIGAVGLDVTHFYTARTQLQVAADMAAHAALYTRHQGLSEVEAKQRAIALVQHSMPATDFGNVLETADITFGSFDAETGVFTPKVGSIDAVRVNTERADSSANPVGSLLFRIVGVTEMDVRASATFVVGPGACSGEGYAAVGTVRIRSGNNFFDDFCVAGSAFQVQNGNWYDEGAAVVIPSRSKLVITGSDIDTHNPGLEEALIFDTIDLTNLLDPVRTNASTPSGLLPAGFAISAHDYALLQPGATTYLDQAKLDQVVVHDGGTYTPDDFERGRIHVITCSASRASLLTGEQGSDVIVGGNNEDKTNNGNGHGNSTTTTGNTTTTSGNSTTGNSNSNGNSTTTEGNSTTGSSPSTGTSGTTTETTTTGSTPTTGATTTGSTPSTGTSGTTTETTTTGSTTTTGTTTTGSTPSTGTSGTTTGTTTTGKDDKNSGGGGGKATELTLDAGTTTNTFRDVVILTDCPIKVSGQVALENAVLSTTDTSDNSVTIPSSAKGFILGRNDNCAEGGGAMLLTRGGIHMAAKPNFFGGQVRALGTVDFQSGADGQGVSVIAGVDIDANSGTDMRTCGGFDDSYETVSFRLIL